MGVGGCMDFSNITSIFQTICCVHFQAGVFITGYAVSAMFSDHPVVYISGQTGFKTRKREGDFLWLNRKRLMKQLVG